MKLLKIYETIIREEQSMSCLVKFGNKLFDPQLSNGNTEPNTDTEDMYLKLIGQFTSVSHGSALRSEFVNAMKELKGCMSSYPEVLQPSGIVYRGDVMSMSDLLGQYEDIEDDLSKGGIFDFNYTPKSVIQSWTTEKDTAEGFAEVSPFLRMMIKTYNEVKGDREALMNFGREISDSLDNITVPVVVKLDSTTDDFLFKAEYFEILSKYSGETELLRLNNQPTRVSGEIVKPLFPSVFGILKAVKQYQVHTNKA